MYLTCYNTQKIWENQNQQLLIVDAHNIFNTRSNIIINSHQTKNI